MSLGDPARTLSSARALESCEQRPAASRRDRVRRARRRAARPAPAGVFAIVLGCSAPRPAEIVFDQGLGDLFVIRVAGNLEDALPRSVEFAAAASARASWWYSAIPTAADPPMLERLRAPRAAVAQLRSIVGARHGGAEQAGAEEQGGGGVRTATPECFVNAWMFPSLM